MMNVRPKRFLMPSLGRIESESIEARIGRKITPLESGCWQYDGKTDPYPRASTSTGGQMPVHRWMYEQLIGPPTKGMHLHHECLNPWCVNPYHLVELTPSQHMRLHQKLRRAA